MQKNLQIIIFLHKQYPNTNSPKLFWENDVWDRSSAVYVYLLFGWIKCCIWVLRLCALREMLNIGIDPNCITSTWHIWNIKCPLIWYVMLKFVPNIINYSLEWSKGMVGWGFQIFLEIICRGMIYYMFNSIMFGWPEEVAFVANVT